MPAELSVVFWFVDISLFNKSWKSLFILKKMIHVYPHVSVYVYLYLPIHPFIYPSIHSPINLSKMYLYMIFKKYLLHIPLSIKYCHFHSEPHYDGRVIEQVFDLLPAFIDYKVDS